MKRRGMTLVEVMVSLAVFMGAFLLILTMTRLSAASYAKQREYLHFEAVCYDIDLYADRYLSEWDSLYFGDKDGVQYYDADFEPIDETGKYALTYRYGNEGELLVTVRNLSGGYAIIEDLNYGARRFTAP